MKSDGFLIWLKKGFRTKAGLVNLVNNFVCRKENRALSKQTQHFYDSKVTAVYVWPSGPVYGGVIA